MKKYVLLFILFPYIVFSQNNIPSDSNFFKIILNDNSENSTLLDTNITIPKLEFLDVPLHDALAALSRAYSLSLYIDSTVSGNIRIRLDNVSLNDALLFIIKEYNLSWEKTGKIIKIYKAKSPPKPVEPLDIKYNNGLITIDVKNVEISRFIDGLISISGKNIKVQESFI